MLNEKCRDLDGQITFYKDAALRNVHTRVLGVIKSRSLLESTGGTRQRICNTILHKL